MKKMVDLSMAKLVSPGDLRPQSPQQCHPTWKKTMGNMMCHDFEKIADKHRIWGPQNVMFVGL